MTRILIVGDIRLYRDGLAEILGRRFDVVGTAAGADETLARADALAPDVVLLDLAMASALDTIRALVAAGSPPRVVALAVPDAEREVIDCAEAGVAGFVTREGSIADVTATIESVARGEAIFSPKAAATLLRRVATLAAERAPGPDAGHLTSRELEIVSLIDEGLSNKEIATRLHIELPTVKNHVHNILEKLNVSRRAEAAAIVRPRLRQTV